MNYLINNRQKTINSVSQLNKFLTTQNEHDIWKSSTINQNKDDVKKFDLLQQIFQELKEDTNYIKNSNKYQQKQFKQQWESQQKSKYHLKYSYFFRQSNFYFTCNIIIFVLKIFLLWFLSVYRTFGCTQYKYGFIFCLVMQILVISLKTGFAIYFKNKKNRMYPFQIQIWDWIQIYGGNIYCLIYSLFGLTDSFNDSSKLYLIVFDLIGVAIMRAHLEQIQGLIKAKVTSPKFKCYFKLVNLMSALLLIIHAFVKNFIYYFQAVLIFFSTYFSQHHFLDHIQNHQFFSWKQLYVYSFYFSGTTVLTVGYGDILPKNFIQIFIVLVMQILGVLVTVYLNGQVGNILCSLRQEQQILQNDLSILQRLRLNFSLSFQTTQKIRKYLFDNMIVDERKLFDEQTKLLDKISSDLKDQACITNHLSLIKQSGFLMMNFSSKAQLLLANKLVRCLYAPNQKVRLNFGSQKLYFLKQGEIAFYISPKQKSNESLRKIIKTISKQNNLSEPSYCFGYTYLISQRIPRLKVITKKFSTCYQIQKQDFLKAISCDKSDFQKYHQLKSIFTTQAYPQKHESEQFYNDKQHYVCKLQVVLAEYLSQKIISKRRNYLRNKRKSKLIMEGKNPVIIDEGSQSDEESSPSAPFTSSSIKQSEQISASTNKNRFDFGSCLNTAERNQKYKQHAPADGVLKNFIVQRKYEKRYCKQAYSRQKSEKWLQYKPKVQAVQQQTGASFTNFHTNYNLDVIMKKMNYYSKILSIFTNVLDPSRRFSRSLQSSDQKTRTIQRKTIIQLPNIKRHQKQRKTEISAIFNLII